MNDDTKKEMIVTADNVAHFRGHPQSQIAKSDIKRKNEKKSIIER